MLVYNGKPGSSRNWDLYPWCCLPKESNIKNKTKQDDADGLKLPGSAVGVSPVQRHGKHGGGCSDHWKHSCHMV